MKKKIINIIVKVYCIFAMISMAFIMLCCILASLEGDCSVGLIEWLNK